MEKKLRIEEIQNKIDNLSLDFKVIEYNGYGKKSKFQHFCGYEFDIRIDHLLNRKVCPKCNGRKYDIEDFQNKSNLVHNNQYEVIDFKGTNFIVKVKHLICGNILTQRGCNHLRGDGCPYCYGNKKYTKEEILKISRENWNNEYAIISENVEYNKKSMILHNTCGNKFEQVIYHHLLKGGCKFCAGNNKHTIQSVQEKSDKIHNNEYTILSEPNGSKSEIVILHKLCGNTFIQKSGDHLSGRGCDCSSISRGERYIYDFLNSFNINFIKQKKFENCRYKKKLRFDFYLPDFNMCIEFDGIQHFEPIHYFGGKDTFELQKIKDNIKNEYCIKNNIQLVRFRYDNKFEKISEDLKKILSL